MDFENIDFNDPASLFKEMGAGGPGRIPMPRMIDAGTIKQQRQKMAARIFSDWNTLKDILDRHQATINKRWAKKTRNQRVGVLIAAWPKMSATHRPDFDAFRRETEQQRESGTKFRDAYLWPIINLEDLAKPNILPLCLDSRGRNSPDAFATADENVFHLGHVSKAIVPVFLNHHVMMFTNRKTPETYGELIHWDEHEDAFNWLHTRKGMHPGSGLVVLEMQERLIRFLLTTCQRIMHDVPTEKLVSDAYAIETRPELPVQTVDGFTSLSIMQAEAPFRPPADMDLVSLEALFAAKQSAAADHIWGLREDPGYFSDAVLEFKEHRQELMEDVYGRAHPILTVGRKEILWQRVLGNLVTSAHMELEVWSELLAQVKHLRVLHSRYASSISIDRQLPDEFLNALLKFRHCLDQGSKGPLGLLKHAGMSSPPMRKYYVREPPSNPTSTKILITPKSNLQLDKPQTAFKWLLELLLEDGYRLFLIGLTTAVDEVDHLLQSEPAVKDMVSTFIASILGDLATFTEGLRQIDFYQPWAQTFEDLMVDKKDSIQKEFTQQTAAWGSLLAGIDGQKVATLGTPEEGRFYYPVNKRRSKENVNAMRAAEANLDAFWAAVDATLRSEVGDQFENTALRKLLSQPRILQRTPAWIESTNKQSSAYAESNIRPLLKPLSELYLNLDQRREGTTGRQILNESVPSSSKAKTRGAPSSVPATDQTDATPSSLPDEQPTFNVDARALNVFRTLFYTPSVSATPGEVAWTDFLHAMNSTGFVPEKLYGSVWQFTPTKLDVERSIQFHQPYPTGKLPYKTARRFGRRLERAYGWGSSMFVLKEKGAD